MIDRGQRYAVGMRPVLQDKRHLVHVSDRRFRIPCRDVPNEVAHTWPFLCAEGPQARGLTASRHSNGSDRVRRFAPRMAGNPLKGTVTPSDAQAGVDASSPLLSPEYDTKRLD